MRDSTPLWKAAFAGAIALAISGLVAMSTRPVYAAIVAVATAVIGWSWVGASSREARRRTRASIAHLSHELRTPLTSVLGLMEVLEDDSMPLEADERRELIGLVRSEALHMNHVVSNLIVSSRVAGGLLQPQPQPIDPVSMVDLALHRVPSVERRTFVSRRGWRPVSADPALMLQILLNLLQNVDRYAPEGEVEVTWTADDGYVVLTISDDGPGLTGAEAFKKASSEVGLGLGLSLSRTLARLMGGDLLVAEPQRAGATIQLRLPHTSATPVPSEKRRSQSDHSVALSPRARLLVDMTDALSERSLDRVVAGLQKLCVEMLGARSAVLATPTPSGGFERAGSFDDDPAQSRLDSKQPSIAIATGHTVAMSDLDEAGEAAWATELASTAALFIPVLDGSAPVGVFVIGWPAADTLPGPQGRAVASALAQLAAFAIDRSALVQDAEFERELRASVMESLPIAISVFAGDPPSVIDWNRREREMLGIDDDTMRPSDLGASQRQFDVRFADGTPLEIDSAPVTQAIRTGRSTGPFLLRIRRADGSETTTRTYCAPFFDNQGNVIGAVVTSEELDAAASSRADPPEQRSA